MPHMTHEVDESSLEAVEGLADHPVERGLSPRNTSARALNVGPHARQYQPLVDHGVRVHQSKAQR